jgi:hypothetical protein
VRIGAQNRANPHTLRQLGALRRRKNRVGLLRKARQKQQIKAKDKGNR